MKFTAEQIELILSIIGWANAVEDAFEHRPLAEYLLDECGFSYPEKSVSELEDNLNSPSA